MAVRDLSGRYVGTFGGAMWAILHPLATVIIYWFVFSVGFKAQGPAGMPFILYFITGLVPWIFFSEVLSSSISAVTANAQLIKRTNFPAEILPVVHLISSSFAHLVLVLMTCILARRYGYGPSLSVFRIFYYYLALTCFVLGLSWLLSSFQVFHRDIGQAMSVILNLWFWLSPIVWSTQLIPPTVVEWLQYNPISFVVDGYRISLLGGIAWMDWKDDFRFWVVTAPVFILGSYVFKKLKSEFAEVL